MGHYVVGLGKVCVGRESDHWTKVEPYCLLSKRIGQARGCSFT
jgi:hypothetical protein